MNDFGYNPNGHTITEEQRAIFATSIESLSTPMDDAFDEYDEDDIVDEMEAQVHWEAEPDAPRVCT